MVENRDLAKAIIKAKGSMTLEQFCSSAGLSDALTSGISSIFSTYNVRRFITDPLRVVMTHDPKMTAATNGDRCIMNPMNKLFTSDVFGDEIGVRACYLRLLGALFHEIGHILYTPFTELHVRMAELERGNLIIHSGVETRGLDPQIKVLKDLAKEKKNLHFLSGLYSQIINIVEDGRIETKLLKNEYFPGFVNGLKLLREHQFEDWTFRHEDAMPGINGYFNTLLMYAKFGELDRSYGRYCSRLDIAADIVNEMLQTDKAKKFFDLAVVLLACISEMIADACANDDSEGTPGEGSDTPSGSGGKSDESEESDGTESDEGEGSDKSSGTESDEEDGSGKSLEDILKELPSMSEMPDIDSTVRSSEPAKKPEEDAEDPTSLARTVAEEIVRKEEEEKEAEESRMILSEGCSSKKYWQTNYKKVSKPADAKTVLKQIETEANERAVEKAANEIKRHFETDMRTGKSKRKLYGKKFHAEKVVNNDFRYFENKKTKKDIPNLAVALCVDESGSMSRSQRYVAARKSAITLYRLFEKVPKMDIAVYGHTADSDGYLTTEIYPYCEFGMKGKDIPEKLTGIRPRCENRDIAAVEFVGEKLLRQPAEIKMMIIITDGVPSATSYGYWQDYEELGKMADSLSKKGVEIIVAAIGNDRKQIQEIYKNHRFLDISNICDLPKELVRVVKRKL